MDKGMKTTTEALRAEYLSLKAIWLAKFPGSDFEKMLCVYAAGEKPSTPAEWVSEARIAVHYACNGAKAGGVCGKYDGKGRINAFSHYANGVCFWCEGKGKL